MCPGGGRRGLERSSQTAPCPLTGFNTHPRWLPVRQSAYGKIGDCEQSNLVQTCSAFLKFRLILFAEEVLISDFFPGGTPLYKPYHLREKKIDSSQVGSATSESTGRKCCPVTSLPENRVSDFDWLIV